MVTLNESIEIAAPPEEVFDWFRNLDKNYKSWHPDHARWRFEGGFEEGTRCQYEELLHGDLHRVNAVLVKVVDNRLIEFRNTFPMSLLCPGGSFIIEPSGVGSLFTATLSFRLGWLLSVLAGRRVDAIRRHMREESQNLKRIIEGLEAKQA